MPHFKQNEPLHPQVDRQVAMRILGSLLMLTLALPWALVSKAQPVTLTDWNRAEELYAAGRYSAALELYETIAGDTGYESAQFKAGYIYLRGLGVPRDCNNAARWFTFAANQGNSSAAYNLYTIYDAGCGDSFPADSARSAHWLRQAAQLGSTGAMGVLARKECASETGDKFSALEMAALAAQSNDGDGIAALGELTLMGCGKPADTLEGLRLLKKAFATESLLLSHRENTAAKIAALYDGLDDIRSALPWAVAAKALGHDGSLLDEIIRRSESTLENSEVARLRAEGMELAGDTAETTLDADQLISSILTSTDIDYAEAWKMLETLKSMGDSRVALAEGMLLWEDPSQPNGTTLAREVFTRACAASPGSTSCLMLARLLLSVDEAAIAKKELSALALNRSDSELPWSPGMLVLLAQTMLDVGMKAEAGALARQLLETNQGGAAALKVLDASR